MAPYTLNFGSPDLFVHILQLAFDVVPIEMNTPLIPSSTSIRERYSSVWFSRTRFSKRIERLVLWTSLSSAVRHPTDDDENGVKIEVDDSKSHSRCAVKGSEGKYSTVTILV